MYGSRGAMMGSGGVSDGYNEGSSKRPRMTESNPYFAVTGSGSSASDYDATSKRPRMIDPNPYFGSLATTSFYQPFSSSTFAGGGSGSLYNFPVVRLRGLPFNCDDVDIFKFFAGLDILDCLLVNKNGRFSGEAFVVFPSPMQAEFALQRDRQNMGRRYVEVFRCKKQDYYSAIAAEVNSGGSYESEYRRNSPPPRPKKTQEDKEQMEYTEVLKLRGLPYSAAAADIVEFFAPDFELSEENVHVACRSDGKATGEAYVEFLSAEVAKKAMCKDKMTIGSRYVELFPSTPEEARRAKSRSRQ
ncbi:heterogeneous nuclear ribonucleoprotein H isoform X1 [Ananas comosus]|uniref:Heterogeneous nuclear ribonucleoprotein F n=2 Tax=Ananas comosus TaxID=4615 RepID=A0A199US40_ANACO|nr:heterogeneous nuclear ribonucleoprotein H isoform X1 [Ananas comosus]OAY67445.1 Heterogeneous nuclear ribonucleoprotein F [Ananas comosus]